MEISFIGSGGAFDYEYGNSAAWVRFQGKNILIDCGNTVYSALRKTGLANHIDYILITHFHDDHVGSLNTTILHHQYFRQPARKAKILVPSQAFQDQLYEFIRYGLIHPEKYVDFLPFETLPGLKGIDTKDLHVKGMQSYGFIFEEKEEVIAYSGDLGDPNIIFDHARPYLGEKNLRVFHEMTFEAVDRGVHCHYLDLIPHMADFRIFGYHIDPRHNPTDNPIPLVANHPELLVQAVENKP